MGMEAPSDGLLTQSIFNIRIQFYDLSYVFFFFDVLKSLIYHCHVQNASTDFSVGLFHERVGKSDQETTYDFDSALIPGPLSKNGDEVDIDRALWSW